MACTTVCEKVTIDDEDLFLVQYDKEADATERESCIQYLRDCGHGVATEPHPVQGQERDGGEPCVSWGDLSDIIEPRDN